MKVVIAGYYGFGNAGDEAVLAAMVADLRRECPSVRPVVLSADPRRTARALQVEAVPRLSLAAFRRALKGAALFISGGGTLLQDATGWGSVPYYGGQMLAARRLGVPVLAYAQGIGPLRQSWSRRLAARALAGAAMVTVRDAASLALARELGVHPSRLHLTADPVFSLAFHSTGRGDPSPGVHRFLDGLPPGPLVGVALRPHPGARRPGPWAGRGLSPPAVLEATALRVAEALRPLLASWGARVLPLPLHGPVDGPVLARLAGSLGRRAVPWPDGLPPQDLSPADWLALFSRLDLCVTMRLHGLIFAACAGVPFVALGIDPKLEAHVAELGLAPQDVAVSWPWPAGPAPAELRERVQQVCRRREAVRAKLQAAAAALAARAQDAARRAAAVMEGRGL
ncbi:MAG: polysaccharide pyruvyl transferase CsaB [Firmicutes bacterium]|nr:polysaccharide pyruvyl transferase CsaB [Bacillota bacterium]